MTVSDERNTPHPEDRLVDLLYPEGQDAARLAALRAEVAADPALSEKLRQYEAVRSMVSELPVPEPERAVHYELLRQARAAAEASGAPRTGLWAWLSTLQLGPVLAGALGLMLAVGGTMMLNRESADFAPAPTAATAAKSEPAVVNQPASAGSKDEWASPQKAAQASMAPASMAPAAAPVAEAPAQGEAAELREGALSAAASRTPVAARRPAGGKADARFDDPFGDSGEGQSGLKGGDANIGGLGMAGAGRGGVGGPAATGRAAEPFPVEQARSVPAMDKLAEEKSVVDAPKARVFAEPPPADSLAQEADDGIVHGVEPSANAPVQAPVAPQRSAEAKPTSAARPKAAPGGGGYAAYDQDESGGETRANAGPRREIVSGGAGARPDPTPAAAAPAPVMAQAPAAPPPPPAEPAARVSAKESAAETESAPVAKKAKAAADAGPTSPLELARMARKVQQWREAARRYEEFIDRFPNHAELPAALFETAETYERLGETARAIELYRLVARNGGGLGDRALDRISELEGKRRKQAAPAKPSPQAAPAMDFEKDAPPAAERK